MPYERFPDQTGQNFPSPSQYATFPATEVNVFDPPQYQTFPEQGGFSGYLSVLGAAGLVQYCDTDVGVTTVGAGASAWLDRVNTANSYAQGDSNRHPAYSATGGPNNAPYIQFVSSGTADLMASTLTLTAPGTNGVYLRMVMRTDTWTLNGTIWTGSSAVNTVMLQHFSVTPRIRQFNGNPGNENSNLAVGSWGVVEAWFSNSVADFITIKGVNVTGTNSGNTSATGRLLGAVNAAGANPSNYSVVRLAAYQAASPPSAGQRTALNAIDAARYGAPVIA